MEEEKIVEAAALKAGNLNQQPISGNVHGHDQKKTHRVESDEDLKVPKVNGHLKEQRVSA